MNDPSTELDEFIGREVVFDVAGPYVYVGTLVDVDQRYITLDNADVHDLRDTKTTRDLYVLDCKRHGIRPNRMRVLVRCEEIISLSAMDDVIE